MNYTHSGEIAALLTACFWTITALAFESATKKVGSIPVNIIRLFIAMIFLSVLMAVMRGKMFPFDADRHEIIWLSLSGIVGFVLGDLFLFASYPLITSRVAMLIMTTVPPITALIGWIVLGERLGIKELAGMTCVMSGIGLTIFYRNNSNKSIVSNLSAKGLLFAFLGAIGQAGGLVLSKYGMKDYDPFASTQIRIVAGIIGFTIMIAIMKRWLSVISTLKNKEAMKGITIGSFFGPFLGVSFSLIAVKYTTTGIASTIMALVPVLIIVPSVMFLKQKITVREIIGALISVGGVVLLFI